MLWAVAHFSMYTTIVGSYFLEECTDTFEITSVSSLTVNGTPQGLGHVGPGWVSSVSPNNFKIIYTRQ